MSWEMDKPMRVTVNGRLFLAVLVVVLDLAAAMAADVATGLPEALAPGGKASIAEVVDGDTVVLDDGRQVRLVGIQAPKLPLGRTGFKAWPLANEAKARLERLILGKRVELRHGGRRTDRHRRVLAHLFLEDGTWVQGRMLREGMARVYTFADNRKLAAEMYALERQARSRRGGIWSHSFYAVRTPEPPPADIGTFQIVEGRVFRTARVRDRVYINFTADWRTDFTLVVRAKDLRMFSSAGLEPQDFTGRMVRARGWLKKWNGPMIELTHPEQIEVLAGNPRRALTD